MKRINLIPLDIQKQKRASIKRKGIVLAGGLSVLVLAGYLYGQYLTVGKLRTAVAQKEEKIEDLQKVLEDKKNIYELAQKEIEALDLERKVFLKRIELLDSKSSKGKAVSNALVSISELIPEDIWLKRIVLNDDTISIQGETLDNTIVSQFMKELDKHEIFEKTDFNYIQKVEEELRTYVDFEITAHITANTL